MEGHVLGDLGLTGLGEMRHNHCCNFLQSYSISIC